MRGRFHAHDVGDAYLRGAARHQAVHRRAVVEDRRARAADRS
jgi:hypothetical protein